MIRDLMSESEKLTATYTDPMGNIQYVTNRFTAYNSHDIAKDITDMQWMINMDDVTRETGNSGTSQVTQYLKKRWPTRARSNNDFAKKLNKVFGVDYFKGVKMSGSKKIFESELTKEIKKSEQAERNKDTDRKVNDDDKIDKDIKAQEIEKKDTKPNKPKSSVPSQAELMIQSPEDAADIDELSSMDPSDNEEKKKKKNEDFMETMDTFLN